MTTILFWISLGLLFYCYFGYGILLYLFNGVRSLFYSKVKNEKETSIIPVTFIVAVHNESAILEKKIQNTLAIDYPKEQLQVIFVDDGSTDDSISILQRYSFIKLIQHKERKGKAAALKSAFQMVQTPVIIFSDANSMLNEKCVLEIISHYDDPAVGGVAGEKRVSDQYPESAVGKGEGIYWKYESFLKKQDAAFYTVVGAAGELFSIRTKLFCEPDESLITDDFFISMRVCLQGYKMAYEPQAYSIETASASISEEAKRKVRIAAGAYQSIGYLKETLNIFKYPLLSFQYLSRRVLRWIFCPFMIPVLFFSNILIIRTSANEFYKFFLYGQLIFYVIAFLGWLLVRLERKAGIATIPFYFIFMNICLVRGLFIYLNKRHTVLWQKSLRTEIPIIPD